MKWFKNKANKNQAKAQPQAEAQSSYTPPAASAPAPAPASGASVAPVTTEPTVEVSDKQQSQMDSDAPAVVADRAGAMEDGDADLTVASSYHKVEDPGAPETKIPGLETKMLKQKILTCWGLPSSVKFGLIAAAIIGAVTLGLLLGGTKAHRNLNIAIVGNSYVFVNDLPRLLEAVSGYNIYQDSCVHPGGSFLNILKTGNGMYYKWDTDNALLENVTVEGNAGVDLYDFGACSVPQLLTGYDAMLSYQNYFGTFIDDGQNPCLQDQYYLQYTQSWNYSEPWDYVVLVDQSKRMCFDDARQEGLLSLNYTYGPIVKEIGARPVIVQPHAFWSENANMTGLSDIPTFTAMIYNGAEIYKSFLDDLTPSKLSAKIAPVGDAYLAIYEDDKDMWKKLFLGDGIHPSGYGSILYAYVLYATIYDAMPDYDTAVVEDMEDLFVNARRLQSNSSQYPSEDDAAYLYKMARKVVLRGYKPSSYKGTDDADSSQYEYYNNGENGQVDGYGDEDEDAEYNEEGDGNDDGN